MPSAKSSPASDNQDAKRPKRIADQVADQILEKIADGIDDLNPFSDKHDDFTKAIFGQSVQLPFDSEGRIILTDSLIKFANILESAAFVGQGRTFQIWNPENLNKLRVQALKRAREDRSSLKLGGPEK